MARRDCDFFENWGRRRLGETDNEYDVRYGNPPEKIINAFECEKARKDTTILENEREDTESVHTGMYMEGMKAEPWDIDGMRMGNELEGVTGNDFLDELHNCFNGFDDKVIDALGIFTQSSISITWVGAREG